MIKHKLKICVGFALVAQRLQVMPGLVGQTILFRLRGEETRTTVPYAQHHPVACLVLRQNAGPGFSFFILTGRYES